MLGHKKAASLQATSSDESQTPCNDNTQATCEVHLARNQGVLPVTSTNLPVT